jgi:phosphatidylglycerol:prolipoprotein diacylglycerol transferase
MIRELFHIGSLSISPFGLMMVAAFLAAYFQLRWGLRRLGAGDDEDASAIVLAAGLGGIVGAKLYYAALAGDWRLIFDRSGLVWYGGFVLGVLAVLWVIRRRRLSGWSVVDATAPALALGYGIGRIGCFLVGDDFGMPTDLPWGVRFPHGLPAPTTAGLMRDEYGAELPPEIPDDRLIAVHPTQLYETTAGLVIWALGIWLLRRGSPRGLTAVVVISLMAVERFFVEFIRAKDDRLWGDFTTAQILSGAILVIMLILALRLRKRWAGEDDGAAKA